MAPDVPLGGNLAVEKAIRAIPGRRGQPEGAAGEGECNRSMALSTQIDIKRVRGMGQ